MSNSPDEQPAYRPDGTPGQIPPGPGQAGQPAPGGSTGQAPQAPSGQPGYPGQPQYGQVPSGQPPYGLPGYPGQQPYGQPQYGQQYGQPGYPGQAVGFGGYAGPDPAALKRATTARTNGILSIVFGGIAFFILPFLSIPGLVLGVTALTAVPKIREAGLNPGQARTLGIIGVVVSALSLAGWIYIRVAGISPF